MQAVLIYYPMTTLQCVLQVCYVVHLIVTSYNDLCPHMYQITSQGPCVLLAYIQ